MKEWNGMRGGGGRSLSGFKTSGARAKVCDEVLTDLRAFGFGGFGRCEGYGGRAVRRRSGGGLKASKTRADVFNEVLTDLSAFGFGGFGGSEGQRGRAVSRGGRRVAGSRRGGGGNGGGKEGGEDVVTVVESGGERRVLEPRGEEGRWSERRVWKEARKLESVGVRAGA